MHVVQIKRRQRATKTEALRCRGLASRPERCAPVRWHVRPVGMDAKEGFPSLFRRWHLCVLSCREVTPCVLGTCALIDLSVVPAAAGLCDRSPVRSSSTSWQMKEPAWSAWRTRCCPRRDYPEEESACLETNVKSQFRSKNTAHKSRGHQTSDLKCHAAGKWNGHWSRRMQGWIQKQFVASKEQWWKPHINFSCGLYYCSVSSWPRDVQMSIHPASWPA